MFICFKVILKIVIVLITSDMFSIIRVKLKRILSNGFMNKHSNDNGYIKMETKGIKIIFMKGLSRFISKKLFINIGILAINEINDVVIIF